MIKSLTIYAVFGLLVYFGIFQGQIFAERVLIFNVWLFFILGLVGITTVDETFKDLSDERKKYYLWKKKSGWWSSILKTLSLTILFCIIGHGLWVTGIGWLFVVLFAEYAEHELVKLIQEKEV